MRNPVNYMVCIVFYFASHVAMCEEVVLRYKYQAGDVTTQTVATKHDFQIRVPGRPEVHLKSSQQIYLTQTITGVERDKAMLKLRITRIRATHEMPAPVNKVYQYDSDQPSYDDPFLKELDARLRSKISVDNMFMTTPLGCVQRVKANQIVSDVDASEPGGQPAETGEEMSEYEQIADRNLLRLPERPLHEGDTWRINGSLSVETTGTPKEIEFTYKGKDSKTGHERIHLEVVDTIGEETETMDEEESEITIHSYSGSGEVLFDNTLGRVATMRFQETIERTDNRRRKAVPQTLVIETSLEDTTGH